MYCEYGDPNCDPDYDADAFFSFDKTPDRDLSTDPSSSDPRPEIKESLIQNIGTVCGAVLFAGIVLFLILLLLALPVAILVGFAIVAWKIVLFTHYLFLIPLLIVGTWLFMILKFVMTEDPQPRTIKS